MTIAHHPSDDTLLALAAGGLKDGPSLVVGAHLSFCGDCRRRVNEYEALGGAVMSEAALLPVSAKMRSSVMLRLGTQEGRPDGSARPRRSLPEMPAGTIIPDSLLTYGAKPWRFIAPGLKVSFLGESQGEEESLLLLRAAPGAVMPSHSHDATEYTCVLGGSFMEGDVRYGTGDLAQAEQDHDHGPKVDSAGPCVCLIAIEGRLRFHGLIGRLLQPFIGI
jgi:putative transcriptional regulator